MSATNLDIDTLTITGAIAALRGRSVSSVELLTTVYKRMLATEPKLHSWVEFFERDALAQAVVADRRWSASRTPPPLLGIPVAIKDIFDVAGKVTRCNSASREEAPVAVRDSEPVHSLRKAGAVLLGKTVTQEFAAGVISAPARNPWDPERIPGGSSGGSAASVAAGTSLGALGSDTGGSIRIPASLTGTVGLKPTYGRVPIAGTFPLSPSLDTAGPITRTVADAAVMYLVLANRHADVGGIVGQLEELATAPSLENRRIGVLTSLFNERLQPDVEAAFLDAVGMLRGLGAEIVECDWEDARSARAVALLLSRAESASIHHHALRAVPVLMGDDVRLRFETGALLSADAYLAARRARVAVRDSIARLFRGNQLDAIVAPTTPATALRAATPVASWPDSVEEGASAVMTRLTMPWNATGQPVISLPCGFDRDHLPIGLSLVGGPDQELDLCEIAQAYERATGWYRQRPPLDGQPSTDDGSREMDAL